MANCKKVIIRLRDNSFGPVVCDGGRHAHSGQLVVRSGVRACLLPNIGGGEVLKIKYDILHQILTRYHGKSVREIVSSTESEDDVVSLSGQAHREMDSPVFTVCADKWRNDEGCLIDCLRIDTGNIMGSLRLRIPGSTCIVELQIVSRFDSGKDQLFLNYLLGKAMGVDFSDFVDSGGASFMQILLAVLLVRAMSAADKVGLLREYRRYDCNDLRPKGRMELNRHIKTNFPQCASIAYSKRELTGDLPVNRLIRHSISLVERKWPWLIVHDAGARHFSDMMKRYVRDYAPMEVKKHMMSQAFSRPVSHPFFGVHYEPLRILSRMLLHGDGLGIYGEDDYREVCGVLFDGAWLWEEYVASILEGEGFVHSNPATRAGVRYAFKSPCDEGELYPDFVSSSRRMILDAKYKRGWIHRDDRLQLMAYAFNTGYERMGLIFPPQENSNGVDSSVVKRELRQSDMARRYFWRNFVFKPINGLGEDAFLRQMEESEGALREFVRHWGTE